MQKSPALRPLGFLDKDLHNLNNASVILKSFMVNLNMKHKLIFVTLLYPFLVAAKKSVKASAVIHDKDSAPWTLCGHTTVPLHI